MNRIERKNGQLFRTLAAVLLIPAVLSAFAFPALAEEAGEDPYVPERYWGSDLSREPWRSEQEGGEADYEALYAGSSLEQLEAELETGDGTEYEVLYDGSGNVICAEYENGGREITFDGSVWRDASGAETSGPELAFMYQYFENYPPDYIVYPDNTLSLVGLPLRELDPALTDRWYHIVPVDLTKEGVFRYDLAASNMVYMGFCEVTVRDGKVTVDYQLPHGPIDVGKQCVAWFTDLGDITREFLENPRSDFRFGEPADIAEDLQGKDTAILFVCNRVTYRLLRGHSFLPQYYDTKPAVKALRQVLAELLARME